MFNVRNIASRAGLAALVSGFVSFAVPATAMASPPKVGPSAPSAAGTVVKSTMTLLCHVNPKVATKADLSSLAAARAYCATHGTRTAPPPNAASSRTPSPAAVTPNNYVPGNCGDSYFYITNMDNVGYPLFWYGVDSYLGPIAYGSASINWDNTTYNFGGSFSDSIYGQSNGGTSWANSQFVDTYLGWIWGYMSGDVLLTNGDVCSILYPEDYQYVD
jgi:hypothetical protein